MFTWITLKASDLSRIKYMDLILEWFLLQCLQYREPYLLNVFRSGREKKCNIVLNIQNLPDGQTTFKTE
jgi:hypothetical protein